MHKDRFKGVGSFEDDLYTGMSKGSSKFLTEARNIGNRDEEIFPTSKPVSGFMLGAPFLFSELTQLESFPVANCQV